MILREYRNNGMRRETQAVGGCARGSRMSRSSGKGVKRRYVRGDATRKGMPSRSRECAREDDNSSHGRAGTKKQEGFWRTKEMGGKKKHTRDLGESENRRPFSGVWGK